MPHPTPPTPLPFPHTPTPYPRYLPHTAPHSTPHTYHSPHPPPPHMLPAGWFWMVSWFCCFTLLPRTAHHTLPTPPHTRPLHTTPPLPYTHRYRTTHLPCPHPATFTCGICCLLHGTSFSRCRFPAARHARFLPHPAILVGQPPTGGVPSGGRTWTTATMPVVRRWLHVVTWLSGPPNACGTARGMHAFAYLTSGALHGHLVFAYDWLRSGGTLRTRSAFPTAQGGGRTILMPHLSCAALTHRHTARILATCTRRLPATYVPATSHGLVLAAYHALYLLRRFPCSSTSDSYVTIPDYLHRNL